MPFLDVELDRQARLSIAWSLAHAGWISIRQARGDLPEHFEQTRLDKIAQFRPFLEFSQATPMTCRNGGLWNERA
jgi:hypothetical protein